VGNFLSTSNCVRGLDKGGQGRKAMVSEREGNGVGEL